MFHLLHLNFATIFLSVMKTIAIFLAFAVPVISNLLTSGNKNDNNNKTALETKIFRNVE